MRRARAAWQWALLCAAAGLAGAAQSTTSVGVPAAAWPAARDARVAALPPQDAAARMALAEEIADRAPAGQAGQADRALALRLAAEAGSIDLDTWGRSAALFIAATTEDAAQRARMEALAQYLGGQVQVAQRPEVSAVMGLLQAFDAYRRGQGVKARAALDQRGVAALLDAHPEFLKGGAARFRADCDAMRGGLQPSFGAAQAEALFTFAAAALAPRPRTWTESLALYGAAPLPELDVTDRRTLFDTKLVPGTGVPTFQNQGGKPRE